MHDPIGYLCGINDDDKLRTEARALGVEILVEQPVNFIGEDKKTQFIVKFQGKQLIICPASERSIQRQANAGRFLAPRYWVNT
jgi:hypothetical protein